MAMLQNAAFVTLLSIGALVLAYFTYGRFIAGRLFQLQRDRRTPAHALEDGVDYVPTRVPVLFGHHFASIAGLGPIAGPALAVIWGWLPAVLWVVVGCIFIGAVHDLGALVVSLRFKGRTIGDVCQDLMGPRARLLALLIIFFLLALAMGAFVNAISGLFVNFNPDAIIPSFGLMLVAMGVGVAVYKLKAGLGPATMIGLILFAGLIFLGVEVPVPTHGMFTPDEVRRVVQRDPVVDAGGNVLVERFEPEAPYGANGQAVHLKKMDDALTQVVEQAKEDGAGQAAVARAEAERAEVRQAREGLSAAVTEARTSWIGLLLVYAFIASVLPVWLLLQPRDYINSFQLYFALATLTVGLCIAAAWSSPESHISAPMVRLHVPLEPVAEGVSAADVPQAPSWLPLLFVTIACGAVSGFHSLVSSGTTVRQLNRETDARVIGYGAMLTEGALAILVIVACVAGLGSEAWQSAGAYGSWKGIGGGGLDAQLNAVATGGAAYLSQLGIPASHGSALLAVTVVAFAMTTLDTGTRLLRFNVEAICRSLHLGWLANRYFASLVAVGAIAFFGLVPAGKVLWTLFGTTNQLLAGLTLLTVSVFLFKLRRPILYTLVPMVVMLALSAWAIVINLFGYWRNERLTEFNKWSLTVVTLVVMVMSVWLIVEGLIAFGRGRGGLCLDEAAPEPREAEEQAAVDAAHLG